MEVITLKERYNDYIKEHPKARIRTIADALGVSEMALLEHAPNNQLTYLGACFKDLLKDMHQLGQVMALTRNEHAVSETKGVYDHVSFMDKVPMGIAHNDMIDMRFFVATWAHVYAVVFSSGKRTLHSFQFFDRYGNAVHKIYTTKESNMEAYHALVAQYTKKEGPAFPLEERPISTAAVVADSEVDVEAFQQAWLEMKDTHDFFGLLKKHQLNRQQAFRLAPAGTTYQVGKDAIVKMLEDVAERKTPIMVFLGNGACLQIFSGAVNKLVEMNGWYNVLDPNFNLHLKLDAIDAAWVVKKHTSDGIVTSLELFDANGEHILYCFGNRKPGIPELEAWRTTVAKLN